MGSTVSRALHLPPPTMSNTPLNSGDVVAAQEDEVNSRKVDYMNLPCPVRYQDLHSETSRILTPTNFEGLKIYLKIRLNEKFAIAHDVVMESKEVPHLPSITKVSSGVYQFVSGFNDPKFLLAGKIDSYGIVQAYIKYNLTSNFSCYTHAKLTNEPHCSQSQFRFEYKGKDYWSQFQLRNNAFYGANYIQSVHSNLSLGTQLIWMGNRNNSVIDFAARYSNNKTIASGQVSSDGSISLSYVRNLSKKVSLASEFKYVPSTRNATSAFGYEYKFRECLLRGKVDTNAVISSYYERKISSGTTVLFFCQIDHVRKNFKFGYGVKFVCDRCAEPYKRPRVLL